MALNLRKTAKKVRGKTKKFAILKVQTARHTDVLAQRKMSNILSIFWGHYS
jgi:hypothetical protein